MGSAGVTVSEVDLSTRVPGFAGVYGAMCIPSKKGSDSSAVLTTSDTDLLKKFTFDERIEVGDDISLFSAINFLAKSNKLWVKRVHKTALKGGVVLKTSVSVDPNIAVAAGFTDPTAYTFAADDAVLVFQKDPGVWGNKIQIKVLNYATSPSIVKEAGAFIIRVYKTGNLNVPVEEHICSRIVGKKDGFGKNIFVDDVLKSSNYIGAVSNVLVDSAVYPKEQPTAALAFAGGTNGDVVTDAEMISASEEFKNTDKYAITLLMDGGWATVDYANQLDSIATTRQDAVALLSVPFAAEDDADYLNKVLEYRNTTLNMNSSYSALYSSHVLIYDRFNDRDLYVDPSGYAGAAISYTASNFEIWYPAAGYKRGTIRAKGLRRQYSKGEMDALYDAGVNPLKFKEGKGIAIWGQKTLSTRPSALDRLNVRLLLNLIEPAISEALEDFTFDLNDVALYMTITAMIESYMDKIQARRGVYDYQVVCNDENNTAEDIDNYILNCDLYVKPTKSAEFIKFRTIITPTGVSFQVAQDSI